MMLATLIPETIHSTTDSVLVVDDNAPSRTALARLLRDAGFAVLEAADGQEALRLLADRPDLVVLDVVLPDTDGYEVCRRIKEGSDTADIPVLMVSGVAVECADRVHGLETGADAYLRKPVEPEELIAHARALLRVRHAEEALRRSEERYRALAESVPPIVWVAGPDGATEYVNRRWQEYTGRPPEDALGRGWLKLVHSDDRDRTVRRWASALRTCGHFEAEYRLRRVDGEYRWHVGSALPQCDRDGRIVRWFGTCTDIDDHRQAQDALHREREFLRAVLENVADGIVACDAAGDITLLNRAARELAGPADEPCPLGEWARRFAAYRPDGTSPLPAAEQPLARALRGEEVADAELVLVARGGRPRTLVASGQPLADARGERLGAVVALHDITERRRLERQYLQSQKMEAVGRLAGGVAHDFNNLLTVINGYAELMLSTLPASAPAHEMAAEVRRAGERAAALTRQLLAFSRQQVLTPQALDLNAVVTDMGKILRRVIGADIDLATALQPGLWPVKADPGQLEQVLLNLAVNARDAMPRGGRLTLHTENVDLAEGDARAAAGPGRYVLLTVSDTGIGMTAEVKGRIFEPFFTTKAPGKGTGLGLATVYGIVQQSGGHVEVDSEPNRGSTFRVYLPVTAEAVRAKSDPDSRPAPQGAETLLLVEDEESVRALAARVLRDLGYTVLVAANGAEALAVGEPYEGTIHLLITDLVLPRLGGRELADRLCAHRPGLRVLFLSGYTPDTAPRLPGVHFLQKPFSPPELARKVRKALDAPA
jgi:two-component system cell cycle sensor histidine kinase/response regulator CckA